MAVQPIVRYMILCEDWRIDPDKPLRISIDGLLTNIHSVDDPPYPLLFAELCVFLVLTEGRGTGTAQIVFVFEETDQKVFATPERQVDLGSDPLEVTGLPFRIRDCPFRKPGIYTVQFWYNREKVEERPLRLR